ncbi:MAG: tRNA (adenosine(37)-N6)-threonylcarbamoyltransferase complex ATPase subunit type 1 TsaE [Ignavibacteriae bacterium]|nr:tRNA (adenosine(37)-N6)-threonylcarbamoyltransferase complex ATPase subunit type 1 TsaE [Ignavibacteriota bacterium]MCB9243954.1 tRNA (adenosine(37)-N6)-threonylcarbamoyltransferase complex ATPase subunit type 1 TsaE [Ignavibacteriales bacterium]
MTKILSGSAEETTALGKEFATQLKAGEIIGLKGELGSGKTQFVKGICSYYGIEDDVNSPTFIIANQYEGSDPVTGGKQLINHLDLYRLNKAVEIDSLGMDNYFDGKSITLIEWSELMEDYLGRELRTVRFEHGEDEEKRFITLPE